MDQNTVNLLLQLVSIASKLAPKIISEVEAIKARTGKTADEIFADADVKLDQNEVKGLAILAGLLTAPVTPDILKL